MLEFLLEAVLQALRFLFYTARTGRARYWKKGTFYWIYWILLQKRSLTKFSWHAGGIIEETIKIHYLKYNKKFQILDQVFWRNLISY